MNTFKMVYGLATVLVSVSFIWFLGAWPVTSSQEQTVNNELVSISEKLLYAVKIEQPVDSIEKQLARYTTNDLAKGLSNDRARKVFWINIYNAYYQLLATKKHLKAPAIFTEKRIYFSDCAFSLDNVEHGILRKYRWKYSLGYLPQFWPGKNIKRLAVDTLDFRIHFALNCGAKSCPPIAFYSYDLIDSQLDTATKSFLINETVVDSQKRTACVTKIMQWFKGDFGGEKGIRAILTTYLGNNFSEYSIQYRAYDWREDLRNFRAVDDKR